MTIKENYTKAVVIGGLIGAILGAGVAYALMQTAPERKHGKDANYFKAQDLLDLTQTAANLINKLDTIRKKTY